jgi:hypothetical protein
MQVQRRGDLSGALRAAGGVLLGLGAIVVIDRRSGPHPWTHFELMLVAAVPAAGLYAGSIDRRGGTVRNMAEPWRAVLLITALLLAPVALFLLLQWVGADTRHLLYDAAALLVTAGIALFGARRARVPYAILLAGIALLGVWMLVGLKIFDHASADTVRWLLLAGGVVLLAAAALGALLDADGAPELATAGGLGAVVAGAIGVFVGGFVPFFEISESNSETTALHGAGIDGAQTSSWNIYLLAISIALVWVGVRSRARGPAYVGVLGLALFLASVTAQVARLESGHSPSHSLLGWPLVLVVLGLAGLVTPLIRRRSD